MDTPGSKKLLLKPATFQKKIEKNGNSSENSTNLYNVSSNPFLKCNEKDDETFKNIVTATDSQKNITKEKCTDDLFKPAKNNLNLFTNATLSDNSSNFVFGQNLRERVVINNATFTEENTSKKSNEKSDSNSLLLFSSALSSAAKEDTTDESKDQNREASTQPLDKTIDGNKEGKMASTSSIDNSLSLVEAAKKYEEMKGAQKRKYDEVEVKTGEEDEKNILEMNCKLFTYDKNNWEERGRGTLRLNDSKNSSRVVFRLSGSYRVLLNTKVWEDQLCEQPSSKSLRLTAFDTNGLLKIYLVMGKNEDIENLYHFLSTRIQREKERTPESEDENDRNESTENNLEIAREPSNKKMATSDE